jgi:hypothetical protein
VEERGAGQGAAPPDPSSEEVGGLAPDRCRSAPGGRWRRGQQWLRERAAADRRRN